MKAVHDILKRKRIFLRTSQIPVIVRGADKNNSLRTVTADQRDQFIRVSADIFPGYRTVRFIADFIQNIGNPGIFFSNAGEKLFRIQ